MSATTDQVVGLSRTNAHGYADPTSYKALKKIQGAEYEARPLTYVCSPFSGNVRQNQALAREFCAFAVAAGYIPVSYTHLTLPTICSV